MFSIVFISKSFLWFHKGSFMMQLHEVCLTVMAGQPGGSVGKAVGHLHWPCSGVTRTPRWLFWIQGRILHRLILARFAISTSLFQQESGSICNSCSSVSSTLWSASEESLIHWNFHWIRWQVRSCVSLERTNHLSERSCPRGYVSSVKLLLVLY